jgi:ribosomal protein S18 acetylase RimI-like enzyme
MEENTLMHFASEMEKVIDAILENCTFYNNGSDNRDTLKKRLEHANFRDLRDLSTMWYPCISFDGLPNQKDKIRTWEDIVQLSNISFSQSLNGTPSFTRNDIEKQTSEIITTLQDFGTWFLPNWIDIFPDEFKDSGKNEHKHSVLRFDDNTNNARDITDGIYDLWIKYDIKARYLNFRLFPFYLPNPSFFETNEPKIGEKRFYGFFAMEWLSQLKVFHCYRANQVIMVTAATGVGKSTVAPMILWKALFKTRREPKIVCTQPRIIPTEKNARRIASQIGIELKDEKDDGKDIKKLSFPNLPDKNDKARAKRFKEHSVIQYRSSSRKTKVSDKDTYLRIQTDGTLLQSLTTSTVIEQDMIMIDECHEHKTNMDLSTTFLKENPNFRNGKKKVVFVSATMDNDAKRYRTFFAEFMKGPVDCRIHMEKPGSTKTQYRITEQSVPTTGSLEDPSAIFKKAHAVAIELAIANRGKPYQNILVFCPGLAQIDKACKVITAKTPSDVICLPLHSKVSKEMRDAAVDDEPKDITRGRDDYNYKDSKKVAKGTYSIKVIIATDIAEASVTVGGLSFVVDTGITKKPRYRYDRGFTVIDNQWISEESHSQRRGRVGRQRPGTFVYLYSKEVLSNTPNYEICNSEGFTGNIFNLVSNPLLKNRFTLDQLRDENGTFYFIHPNENDHQRIEPLGNYNPKVGEFKNPVPSQYVDYTLFYLRKSKIYGTESSELVLEISNKINEALQGVYPSIWQINALTYAWAYRCLYKMCQFVAICLTSENNENIYTDNMRYLNLSTFHPDGKVKNMTNQIYEALRTIPSPRGNPPHTFEDCLASAMPQRLMTYEHGKFLPLVNYSLQKSDDVFVPMTSKDAFRRCWFYRVEKEGSKNKVSNTIPYKETFPLENYDYVEILPSNAITVLDAIENYYDYRYNVFVPELERIQGEQLPAFGRNRTFKQWVTRHRGKPVVTKFYDRLKAIRRRLTTVAPDQEWTKDRQTFIAIMDILNFSGDSDILRYSKTNWKGLFDSDRFIFTHRTDDGDKKLNIWILLIQLKRWTLVYQINQTGLKLTTRTVEYISRYAWVELMSYIETANLTFDVQDWLIGRLLRNALIRYSDSENKRFLKNARKGIGKLTKRPFQNRIDQWIIDKLKVKHNMAGGNSALQYYIMDAEKARTNPPLFQRLRQIHNKAFGTNTFEYAFDSRAKKLILVTYQSQVAGFGLIDTPGFYLHDLCTANEYENQGVASMLLRKAKKEYPNLWLKVEQRHWEKLGPFYKKRGFKKGDETMNYISMVSFN